VTKDVINTLKNILVDELFVEVPQDQIDADDGLQSVLGLDSVGFIELRVHCERLFGVPINDEDFSPDNFRSLSRVARLIARLKSGEEVIDAS
jgi:acyl carrier protein